MYCISPLSVDPISKPVGRACTTGPSFSMEDFVCDESGVLIGLLTNMSFFADHIFFLYSEW
jgi:hypothetical protein